MLKALLKRRKVVHLIEVEMGVGAVMQALMKLVRKVAMSLWSECGNHRLNQRVRCSRSCGVLSTWNSVIARAWNVRRGPSRSVPWSGLVVRRIAVAWWNLVRKCQPWVAG